MLYMKYMRTCYMKVESEHYHPDSKYYVEYELLHYMSLLWGCFVPIVCLWKKYYIEKFLILF